MCAHVRETALRCTALHRVSLCSDLLAALGRFFSHVLHRCRTQVSASSEAGAGGGTTLSYTGYVDRGARIEARFSKRFLKMTGRITTVVRGQERPSTRFAMRLVARGEGIGLGV